MSREIQLDPKEYPVLSQWDLVAIPNFLQHLVTNLGMNNIVYRRGEFILEDASGWSHTFYYSEEITDADWEPMIDEFYKLARSFLEKAVT